MLIGVVIGLVVCVGGVVMREITDPGSLALVTTIAGALLKMLSDAFAFEFGSSAGSKNKDHQIERFQEALIDVNQARIERGRSVGGFRSPHGALITDGPVVAVGEADVVDVSESAFHPRNFVAELRRMAGVT